MSKPFKSFESTRVISTIMDSLRDVGFQVASDVQSVGLDSEQYPTRIKLDEGDWRKLSEEEASQVLAAVQLHRVRHRVGSSAAAMK